MRKITRRSFLTAAVACGAAAALSACGGSSSASSAAASSTVASASVAAASNGEKFTVGICQLVQHAALDAATQGFEDALTASFGENVTFDFQNAQGDSATCATIANGFVSSGVALIMANATPALQLPLLPRSLFWAPPLPSTAWHWVWITFPAPWAATSPAPPIWHRWISRQI